MPKTYSLNKFWHTAGDLLPRRAQTVVTLLILLFFLYKTGAIFKPFLFPDVNGYGYTEMLIDYGGGFVRQTFANHLYNNFCMGYSPWLVVPVRLLMMMLIYYLLSNFLFTFRKTNCDASDSEKTSFSALLLFSLFCLLPMFTILSCDYGRIYQYAAFSTVGAFVILGRERLAGLFPQGLLRGVARLNARLARLVSPRPWLMVAMLVLVASSPACFSPWIAAKQSILGSLIYYTHYAAKLL